MNIPYSGKLQLLRKDAKLINSIYEDIKKSFVELPPLKFNIELINKIANEIEDYQKYKLSNKKIDKINLFFNIHKNLFGNLTDAEKQQIIDTLTFLNDNGKIKPRTLLKYVFDLLRSFFLKE